MQRYFFSVNKRIIYTDFFKNENPSIDLILLQKIKHDVIESQHLLVINDIILIFH